MLAGKSTITLDYNNNSNDKIILNNTNADIDVQIMNDDGTAVLHTDAATNRVGIGTTAPGAALHVSGSGSTGGQVFRVDSNMASDAILFVTGSGYVGIGTDAPRSPLVISALDPDMNEGLVLQNSGAANGDSTGIYLKHYDGRAETFIRDELNASWGTKLQFGTSLKTNISSIRMTLDNSGSLGIGTTTPETMLHVSGSGSTGGAVFRVDSNMASDALLFVTGSGRVGIGTATPATSLHVYGTNHPQVKIEADDHVQLDLVGTAGNHVMMKFDNQGGTNWYIGQDDQPNPTDDGFSITHTTNASPQFYIHTNGDIGMGLAASAVPEAKLHVSSSTDDVLLQVDGTIAGTVLFVTGSGKIGVNTTTPAISLDVHYTGSGDPTALDDDTGGGEVVYFGTSSASGLEPGALYYLNYNGGWASASAGATGSDPVNGGGHNQLLALSLGNNPDTDGMLLRGFFHADSYYEGDFQKGGSRLCFYF